MNEPLQETFWESDRAKLLRWLPWLHLLRGFRLATRWQNLTLALLGLLLLSAGRWGLSHSPFSSYSRVTKPTAYREVGPWEQGSLSNRRTLWPCERDFLSPALPTVTDAVHEQAVANPLTLLAPLGDFVRPASLIFQRRNSWANLADAWLHVLLVLAVGSVIGGAITRRVALEFGLSRELSLRESLRFAMRESQFALGAPLISVVGVGLLLLLGRIIAWSGRIPGVGETIAALGWGLILLISLVMALILLGVAVAWPLMVAAHSCEGTDGFDALNRAYNYVFVRPWYAAWLLFVTLAYGTVLISFVLLLTGLTVHLSEWIAAGPLSDESLATITQQTPPLVDSSSSLPTPTRTLATWIGGFWQRGLAGVLTAFVYSFFWTSATLIYLLLRQSTDACELTRIYLPKPRPDADGPPLVGIPAAERREAAANGKASADAPSPDPLPNDATGNEN